MIKSWLILQVLYIAFMPKLFHVLLTLLLLLLGLLVAF